MPFRRVLHFKCPKFGKVSAKIDHCARLQKFRACFHYTIRITLFSTEAATGGVLEENRKTPVPEPLF